MRREVIYRSGEPCSGERTVYGYYFGSGEKSACIAGPAGGSGIQQMYVCSQLVRALNMLEKKGAFVSGNQVLMILPALPFSADTHKEFWEKDSGDRDGTVSETDLSGAAESPEAVMADAARQYKHRIQISGFSTEGEFVPHVRVTETNSETSSLAGLFGLPYVMARRPGPGVRGTGDGRGQVWENNGFFVYAGAGDHMDERLAGQTAASVLRFLTRAGILRYTSHSGYIATVLREEDLTDVKADRTGICRRLAHPGQEVYKEQVLAQIIDPLEGEIVSQIKVPAGGIIFFAWGQTLVTEEAVAFRIIKRLHQ